MKIRLQGTAAECQDALDRIRERFTVLSAEWRNPRSGSFMFVYIEARL